MEVNPRMRVKASSKITVNVKAKRRREKRRNIMWRKKKKKTKK